MAWSKPREALHVAQFGAQHGAGFGAKFPHALDPFHPWILLQQGVHFLFQPGQILPGVLELTPEDFQAPGAGGRSPTTAHRSCCKSNQLLGGVQPIIAGRQLVEAVGEGFDPSLSKSLGDFESAQASPAPSFGTVEPKTWQNSGKRTCKRAWISCLERAASSLSPGVQPHHLTIARTPFAWDIARARFSDSARPARW